jgi:hypothetical protein
MTVAAPAKQTMAQPKSQRVGPLKQKDQKLEQLRA